MTLLGVNLSMGNLLAMASLAIASYLIFVVLYNHFLHPLHSFPGPFLWRTTRIPYCISLISGRLPFKILDLHRRYGSVVRIGPDELVFADARAWRDIMGHRGPGEPEMGKATQVYRPLRKGMPNTLINAGREEHGRLRRQLAHGFSGRSMREQQPIIVRYVDLMVERLKERCQGGRAEVDMVKWYNYATFDIIGDLAFGETFGCLDAGEYHPWVAMIFAGIKLGTYLQVAKFFPFLMPLLLAAAPRGLKEKREEHLRLTKEKLLKRMELGAERPDLVEGLLRKDDNGNPPSMERLRATSSLLIVAGSETTATLLSGVTYLLAKNPDALAKLTKEVRTAFRREEDIDFTSVSQLQYMLACLDEGLRIYPPAPLGLPRQVPQGGGTIAGHWVPEDTVVSQYHYALYHNEKFFAAPEEFHPERWLGDPRFAAEDRDIFQPFHVGPRNCIGRNLAYVEMRTILARVLWNFDLRLADSSKNWLGDQKIYLLWEKGPLYVHLTLRH